MRRRSLGPAWALIALAGCAPTPEPAPAPKAAAAAPEVTVRQLKDEAGSKRTVTLRGTIVEKCPTAGCWFRLKDGTGVAKVDLKMTGITVTDLPLGTAVVAQGVAMREGGEVLLSADTFTH